MIKLTSKRHHTYPDLRQVKALVDIPHLNVSKGDLGGYVHKNTAIHGQCWVDPNSTNRSKHIYLRDSILLGTTIHPEAQGYIQYSTLNNTYVLGRTDIYLSNLKDVKISDSSVESSDFTDCRISNLRALNSKLSFKNTPLIEYAIIRDGRITHPSQIHSVHPIGSEDSTASVYPGLDGTPTVSVGCWTGLLSHLPEEVSDRIDPDGFSPEEYNLYHAQYKAFQMYAEALAKTWKGTTP